MTDSILTASVNLTVETVFVVSIAYHLFLEQNGWNGIIDTREGGESSMLNVSREVATT